MTPPIRIFRLGCLDYDAAWQWQETTAAAVRQGAEESLAIVEHPAVYTFGRRVRPEHLLVDRATLRRRGAAVIESDRGGDVTFHGPGQLVAYPILDLRRRGLGPIEYVRALEQCLIEVGARFGLRAERVAGRPGVWVAGAKIGAVGVRIQGGVSTHGIALNVENDLSWFEAIVPCGISDAGVTSLERALGSSPGLPACETAFIDAFGALFDAGRALTLSSPTGRGLGEREAVLNGR